MSYEGKTRMGTIKGRESCEFWLKLMKAYKKAMTVGTRTLRI